MSTIVYVSQSINANGQDLMSMSIKIWIFAHISTGAIRGALNIWSNIVKLLWQHFNQMIKARSFYKSETEKLWNDEMINQMHSLPRYFCVFYKESLYLN